MLTTRTLRPLPTRIPQLLRPIPTQCRRHTTHNNSVDPTEVSHFSALAAEWWDPHGTSRLLHLMNPLRLQFLRSCLARGHTGAESLRFLDVGCGGGILAESLARLRGTESVLGIDPTPGVLAIAKAHMRKDPALAGKLEYLETTIHALEETGGERVEGGFDVVCRYFRRAGSARALRADGKTQVTTMEVVEHVSSPAAFLRECMSHVKPGGWLLGSTIARTWTSYLTTKLVAEDILNIVPRGTHDWNKYVNADELRDFFTQQKGWESAAFMGCIYVPGLGWRMLDHGEKVGNYFFAVRKSLG